MSRLAAARQFLIESFAQVTAADDAALAVGQLHEMTAVTAGRACWRPSPMTVTFEAQRTGSGLTAAWRYADANDAQRAFRRLIGADRTVSFAYFAPGRGWSPEWNEARVPQLVSVRIGSVSGEDVQLVIPVGTTKPAACVFLTSSKICRGTP